MERLSDTPSVLKSIRGEATDIYNRIQSIHEDSQFVTTIAEQFPMYPMFANQRCGAWYTDSSRARSEYVYFKSTDGHFGQWTFNLRRANLHLLPIIHEHGGMILVDSTRSGKFMPDAFSKTVPLWCAVINACLRYQGSVPSEEWEKNEGLFTPPKTVSESEKDQMNKLIPRLAKALSESSFVLPSINKPLKPFWITPQSAIPAFDQHIEFFPVICISASRQVADGMQRRTNYYTYVQGSGDDHESWSMGLTPSMYWNRQRDILSCNRETLPGLINQIVADTQSSNSTDITPKEVDAVGGQIAFSTGIPSPEVASQFEGIITVKSTHSKEGVIVTKTSENHLEINLSEGKRDQLQFLHQVLPAVDEFGRRHLDGSGNQILIVDEEANYDASVGILMLILGRYFDDSKKEVTSQPGVPEDATGVDSTKHSTGKSF
ncbi:initiator tRNA phosphoribosyl transferase [Serendipita vermifera]|nr:initiator tRNA phosphoribosyl transferase [Serendipita vermifera]